MRFVKQNDKPVVRGQMRAKGTGTKIYKERWGKIIFDHLKF